VAALASVAETAPEAAFKAKGRVPEKTALGAAQIQPPVPGYRLIQAPAVQVAVRKDHRPYRAFLSTTAAQLHYRASAKMEPMRLYRDALLRPRNMD